MSSSIEDIATIRLHRPTVVRILDAVRRESFQPFHTISLADHSDTEVIIFVEGDWAEWDAIVDAVAKHRGA
jgi:hypothetical protein